MEEGSIIIIDNASYHSVVENKIPNMSSKKKKNIMDLLQLNNIPFKPTDTIRELLKLIAPFKNQQKQYVLDRIANEMGHEVIRLPPYHCQYNLIELIWAKVKREIADRNTTFRLAVVEKLMHEAIDNTTQEDWISRVRHAEQLQEDNFHKEVARDETIESIIINLKDESNDSVLSDTEDGEDTPEYPAFRC